MLYEQNSALMLLLPQGNWPGKMSSSYLQGWSSLSVHTGYLTDLDKFSVWISKDEDPTPLPVVGPLFIFPRYFIFLKLGVWHFGLLRCFYSSFHNRVDLIMEPAFYWVFYFPNLSLFVSSYVKMKKFCLFTFNSLAILWPPCVTFWGWASYWYMPFTVFSLGLLFCFSRYIVRLWCTSEGGSLDV